MIQCTKAGVNSSMHELYNKMSELKMCRHNTFPDYGNL